jgi:NAD(P)-dependent dehydrogenase (short-subunit alcohol dehydrogenase family)
MTGFRGLQGRRTLITCAASGIGRATAIRLAKEGAIVGILDLDGDGAEETAGMLRSAGAEESAEGGAALKEKRDPDFRRFK